MDGTKEVRGIEGNHYVGSERTFDNGSLYPEQKCFNSEGIVLTGSRDVSKCRYGAPAFLTFPHFYLADKEFLENVEGLKPKRNLHELHLELEPVTGIPLSVEAKAQINLRIEPVRGIK